MTPELNPEPTRYEICIAVSRPGLVFRIVGGTNLLDDKFFRDPHLPCEHVIVGLHSPDRVITRFPFHE